MRIFLSTGEPSGDLHAANLIHSLRKLRPDVEVVGFGGPRMDEAGARLLYPAGRPGGDVVPPGPAQPPQVLRAARRGRRATSATNRPDAVVLIDYPGFHWHLAKRAKKHGHPGLLLTSRRRSGPGPAGGSRRSRSTSTTSCAASRSSRPGITTAGVAGAVYVGHPYFDELAERVARRPRSSPRSRPARPAGGDPAGLADPGGDAEPADHAPGRREAGRATAPTSGSPSPASTTGIATWPPRSSRSRAWRSTSRSTPPGRPS